jgi:hypothetical protein
LRLFRAGVKGLTEAPIFRDPGDGNNFFSKEKWGYRKRKKERKRKAQKKKQQGKSWGIVSTYPVEKYTNTYLELFLENS